MHRWKFFFINSDTRTRNASYCVFSFLPIGIFSFILYQRKSNTRYKMCYFCHSFTLKYFNFTGFLTFFFYFEVFAGSFTGNIILAVSCQLYTDLNFQCY